MVYCCLLYTSFRNELLELRNDPEAREDKRRNGAVYLVKGGTEKGKGPFTLDAVSYTHLAAKSAQRRRFS